MASGSHRPPWLALGRVIPEANTGRRDPSDSWNRDYRRRKRQGPVCLPVPGRPATAGPVGASLAWGVLMDSLRRDIAYAVRLAAKWPGFTAVVVLIMALQLILILITI